MPVTIEIPVQWDVVVGLDLSDPDDAADFQRIQQRRQGLPISLIHYVVNKTKAGREFVRPLAAVMAADTAYQANELAALLGPHWTPKKVATTLAVLGKPEKRFRAQIFQRVCDDKYSITPAMKAAIGAAYMGEKCDE